MSKGKALTRPQKIALAGVAISAIGVLATIYIHKSGGEAQKVDLKIKGNNNAVTINQHYGLDANEAGDIANELIKPYKEENKGLFQEIGSLKEQLTSALQRVSEAEARGNIPEAKGVIEELRKTGDTKRLLDVLVKERDLQKNSLIERNREIAAVAYLRGDIEVARTAVEEILKLRPNDVDALNRKGYIELLQGNLNEAEKIFSRVSVIGVANNDDLGQAIGSGHLGLIYLKRGELDKAEEMFKKALEINEKLGRQEGMANQYGNLGLVYQDMGELDKAEEMLKKSLEIAEKLGLKEIMANQYGNLGLIYRRKGELDKAEEMHKKSLEIAEKIGLQEIIAGNYGNLGVIYKQRGDLGKAREYWEKALNLYIKIGVSNEVKKVEGLLEEIKGK